MSYFDKSRSSKFKYQQIYQANRYEYNYKYIVIDQWYCRTIKVVTGVGPRNFFSQPLIYQYHVNRHHQDHQEERFHNHTIHWGCLVRYGIEPIITVINLL